MTAYQIIEIVNGGENKAEAVLNADLDMEEFQTEFVPIGNDRVQYGGKFNGQGHTIKNLNIRGKNNVGFFGKVSTGVEIQGLILDASCSVTGANYVGGIVGYALTGNVRIKKCGLLILGESLMMLITLVLRTLRKI